MDISKLKGFESERKATDDLQKTLDAVNNGPLGQYSKWQDTVNKLSAPFAGQEKLSETIRQFESPLKKFTTPKLEFPMQKPVDMRTRQERKDDRQIELSKLNIDDIRDALEYMRNEDSELREPESVTRNHQLVVDNLELFLQHKTTFEDLNSDHSRRIALRKNELDIEADADLKEKWRTFKFRVLGSGLLVATLFVIGTINHHVSWLHLPFESLLKPSLSSSSMATQAILQNKSSLTAPEKGQPQPPNQTEPEQNSPPEGQVKPIDQNKE